MKFLADENFPQLAVNTLRENGFDVSWISEDAPGASDPDVLATSARQDSVLLTLDKDFGELVFHQGLSASNGVILFRVSSDHPAEFAQTILTALRSRADWTGHFSVITDSRIRMTPLPGHRPA